MQVVDADRVIVAMEVLHYNRRKLMNMVKTKLGGLGQDLLVKPLPMLRRDEVSCEVCARQNGVLCKAG